MQQCHSIQGLGITQLRNLLTNYTGVNLYIITKYIKWELEKICHNETYVGKRIRRGLFKTKEGVLINADINGSYNIMRKVKGDAIMPPYTGFGYNPVKKFIN